MTTVADVPRAVKVSRRQNGALFVAAARSPRGMIGLTLAAVVVLVAFVGPFLAPHSSTALVTQPFASASRHYPLGSDTIGRDVLSRVLVGGRVLLVMALLATLFALVLGAAAGISAAYLRGKTDDLIMRTVDVILSFPQIVFALLLVSVLGPQRWLIVIAVGLAQAPAVARVLRAATLEVSERDYVKAIEIQGVKARKVMASEILPNLVSPLMVQAGLMLTYSIVVIAGLAFLGFGEPPPAANWGYMINENRVALQSNPLSVIAPAALIVLLTVGTNTFTDAFARAAIGVDRKSEEAEPTALSTDVLEKSV